LWNRQESLFKTGGTPIPQTCGSYLILIPYQQQSQIPVIKTLVTDDAPQFKLLTDDLSLCWVHEARHYKKLSPFVTCHQKSLDKFLDGFWDYYRELLAYRNSPSPEEKLKLKLKFLEIFGIQTGYEQLDERKKLTLSKISELLLVLEHPELPLHNNPAEFLLFTASLKGRVGGHSRQKG